MKDFFIIASTFLEENTGKLLIGGVQTYIRDLALLAIEKGYKTVVYQIESRSDKEYKLDGIIIKCFPYQNMTNQKCFDYLYKIHNSENSIFIIATDQLNIKHKANNIVTIQHGVAFDIPGDMLPYKYNKIMQHVNKLMRCIYNVKRFYMTKNTVCVDYNYYNWFRTIGTIYSDKKVFVIPNYTSNSITLDELNNKLNKNRRNKILFARRFCDYRGAMLFATVIKRLMVEFPDVEVTFAGSGPLEKSLKDLFKNTNRVSFAKFFAPESIDFHKNYDIAVVPTIFSEGTSLSLIEAMASGCFPIATHVGGMTNIILDRFNGLLCLPEEDALYYVLKETLNMSKIEFDNIVKNAFNSSITSFSYDLWKNKWIKVIDFVANNK